RVNSLSTIPITFKQHLGSFLPRTTFLAFNAPAKRVGRVKKRDPRPNLPGRPLDPVQVLVARPDGLSLDEFNEQLTPALRAVSLSALPEQPLGSKYWGMRKYIEFVVFRPHPPALPGAPGPSGPAPARGAGSWSKGCTARTAATSTSPSLGGRRPAVRTSPRR